MASAERLIEVFDGARSRAPGPERERYIEVSCADEPELREQVCSLLEASEEAGEFLTAGVPSPAAALPTERPGDRIGRYRLLQPIGEGGCGIVYLAEQEEPVRRRVALKVIKLGMDTREVAARFEAERQALAMMDHPNIAKVFDAGATDAGRPFFVMELVTGIKLTEYCDRHHLPTDERLQLFAQVCHAIQHAHQKGVIHRDIKPSNILVAESDGVAVPKVIDFGIAKATEQRLTAKTVFTGLEQFIGTPAYMSPEQATMTSLDIDTRSDIYSLGVLLYELLTGKTPFDAGKLIELGIEEIRRTIREEEPLKPSTRLSTLTQSDLSLTAASRRTDPPRLLERVRGDLDWIALKCLEKDRTRRYETANGLARDIEHYLRDEPVLASPPSAWYRIRKFVRRRKGPVLAGSLLLLALLAGVIGTTWGLLRARNALELATRSEREKTEKLVDSLIAQAQANRLSGRPGQRFDSLDALDKATQLARSLGSPPATMREIRTGMTAALARPDLRFTPTAASWLTDSTLMTFDSRHEQFARVDLKGNCSVRRVSDDMELFNLPGLGFPAYPWFSPDGSHIALRHMNIDGSVNRAVHVWRLSIPPQRILEVPKARWAVFRGTNEVLIVHNDGRVTRFGLSDGRPLNEMPAGPFQREVFIVVHPSDPLMAVYSYFTDVVEVRNVETGELVKSLPQTDNITGAAWLPQGKSLAIAEQGKWIHIYDCVTWEAGPPLKTRQTVTMMAFNSAGNLLASVGWQGGIDLNETTGGTLIMTDYPSAGALPVWNGARLAGGVHDGKVGIWDTAGGEEFRTLTRSSGPPDLQYLRVAVHPNGRWLAVSMSDGFGIWDLESRHELAFVPADFHFGYLFFEPSGNLLTLLRTGLTRWPVKEDTGVTGGVVIGPAEPLGSPGRHSMSQSRDGSVIVTCDRALMGQEARAGGWIHHGGRMENPIRIAGGADVTLIAVDPGGKWVVTATHAVGNAKLWNAADGTFVRTLVERNANADEIHFSSDGQWLSMSHDGGRVLSTETWEAGPPVGKAAVFSPDGRMVAVQVPSGVRLVEHTTGREIALLEDPYTYSPRLNLFSLDGTKLISVNTERGIYVWDLKLIRQQLKARGLDWEWPELPDP